MKNLRRRSFLGACCGAATSTITGCITSGDPLGGEVKVDIYSEEFLKEMSDTYRRPETHAMDVTAEALRLSLRDLASRVEGLDYEVRVREEAVDYPVRPPDGLMNEWLDSEQVKGSGADCVLLLAAARGSDPPAAASGKAAFNRTTPATFAIAENDVEESSVVRPHSSVYDAYRSLQLSIHEVGHTIGLDHDNSRISREEFLRISPMAMGYWNELGGEENSCGETNAEPKTTETRTTNEFFDREVVFEGRSGDTILDEPVDLSLTYCDCAVEKIR